MAFCPAASLPLSPTAPHQWAGRPGSELGPDERPPDDSVSSGSAGVGSALVFPQPHASVRDPGKAGPPLQSSGSPLQVAEVSRISIRSPEVKRSAEQRVGGGVRARSPIPALRGARRQGSGGPPSSGLQTRRLGAGHDPQPPAAWADCKIPVFEPSCHVAFTEGATNLTLPRRRRPPNPSNPRALGPWVQQSGCQNPNAWHQERAGAGALRAAEATRFGRCSRFPSPPSFQWLRGCALRRGSVASSNHTTAICSQGGRCHCGW